MNLKRGLLRLWIIATVLWLAGFVWYFWTHLCIYSTDNRLMCLVGEDDWVGRLSEFSISTYGRLSMIALSVPVGVLLIGYAIAWAYKQLFFNPKPVRTWKKQLGQDR